MRVIVLGGTWFIGRAVTEALTAAGHAVLVAHRGISEPSGLPAAEHLHAERATWPGHAATFAAFGADAAVDVSAANRSCAAPSPGTSVIRQATRIPTSPPTTRPSPPRDNTG